MKIVYKNLKLTFPIYHRFILRFNTSTLVHFLIFSNKYLTRFDTLDLSCIQFIDALEREKRKVGRGGIKQEPWDIFHKTS